jgi:hypothetical protein
MADEILLTHCGKLGDFMYCLPIAEWFYRQHGRKTHWVLPEGFGPFRYIERLLMMQDHCARVSLVPFKVQDYDCGGQPYHFNPAEFGIDGDYYNLGFRHYPNAYLSQFYSEEYGLEYIRDYRINIGNSIEASDEILRTSESRMALLAPHAKPLPTVVDLLDLIRRLAAAKERHSWFCGIAVLMYFAGLPQTVYRVNGHAAREMYFPMAAERGIEYREVA